MYIMRKLLSLGIYNIYDKILGTKRHGIPHSRRRWYCVGMLKSIDDGSFEFPGNIPRADIELFLEKPDQNLVSTGMPSTSQATALTNVQHALRTLEEKGVDPKKRHILWIVILLQTGLYLAVVLHLASRVELNAIG